MAGPVARIVAQLIVQGASIFTRAFFTAYQQALRSMVPYTYAFIFIL